MKIGFLTTDNREYFRKYTSPAPEFGTAPEALLQGFKLLPRAEVHIVSCTRAPMESPGRLSPNIYYHRLSVPKYGWMTTAYQGTIRAIRKLLKSIRPDIVHGQGTERDCAMNAVFSGFPSVLTIHGNMRRISRLEGARPFSYLWLAARLETLAVRRSHGVICITPYTQKAMASLARRTWVVPNAVEASFFDINAEPPPDKIFRILCVAVVCKLKNQNALIRALDPVAEKHKLHVTFLGLAKAENAYAAEFLGLVRTRPWCVHGGFAERDKLKAYFRQANLLVLPSLEDNCPMVVLEAMAAGVPVLGARVGGVPDIIEDGATGALCDPLDLASMRAGVEKMIAEPAAAQRMAIRAREHARDRFHPRAVAQRHLEIYEEVLTNPS